ncbi:hypothetical protein [Arcobacter sp. FWKO B]|uniref:hypothetical protein n=1 Tax=Arcobacter sp. FWKO B TaxID=2593672 RepID=UPI0018A34B73|nr:hypothetical protein [Arcobacter sp. FWKO B]QOG11428.1 hypothetical protein FWKOB_01395 [Arcobacter sp. FWKO B]
MITITIIFNILKKHNNKIDSSNIKQFIKDLQLAELEQMERNNELYKRTFDAFEYQKKDREHSSLSRKKADELVESMEQEHEL